MHFYIIFALVGTACTLNNDAVIVGYQRDQEKSMFQLTEASTALEVYIFDIGSHPCM